jgi:4,5-DOPA dioxygenase extradiol
MNHKYDNLMSTRDLPTTRSPLPAGFVSHGAPTAALDAGKGAPWAAWGEALGQPDAILVISAHWERSPLAFGTTRRRELIYDFSGFPDELYRVQYPAPGAAELAIEASRLLGDLSTVEHDEERGLDHGTWVPLVHMFPQADIPVLQLSLPTSLSARTVYETGTALRPLREQGVFILGSGGMVHNLGALGADGAAVPAWSTGFDDWIVERLAAGDVASIAEFEQHPLTRYAHPRTEHFLPMLAALGAAGDDIAKVTYTVEGFEFGSLSRRAVQFG